MTNIIYKCDKCNYRLHGGPGIPLRGLDKQAEKHAEENPGHHVTMHEEPSPW